MSKRPAIAESLKLKPKGRDTSAASRCRTLNMITSTLAFASVLVGLTGAPTCVAQVQLPTVNLGQTNFEDGFGSPGWLLEEFPMVNSAGELRDAHGNRIPGRNTVTAISTTTHVVYASTKRVAGGWVAVEALQPLVDVDLNLAKGGESRVRGFADLIVGAGLQWVPKKIGTGVLAQRVMFDVNVPTGKYSDVRPLNIGNHLVSLNPYYAFTYERKKAEFSARLHYLWNSSNDHPFVGFGFKDIQPGQAFHVNYATSYEVVSHVRLGFNGYWLQQLTDHEINGLAVPYSKERAVGLGPGIQFSGRGTWFRMNSYMETDVRNRPSGVMVTFRISKALPTGGPRQ